MLKLVVVCVLLTATGGCLGSEEVVFKVECMKDGPNDHHGRHQTSSIECLQQATDVTVDWLSVEGKPPSPKVTWEEWDWRLNEKGDVVLTLVWSMNGHKMMKYTDGFMLKIFEKEEVVYARNMTIFGKEHAVAQHGKWKVQFEMEADLQVDRITQYLFLQLEAFPMLKFDRRGSSDHFYISPSMIAVTE